VINTILSKNNLIGMGLILAGIAMFYSTIKFPAKFDPATGNIKGILGGIALIIFGILNLTGYLNSLN
jgi:hypothetical protein